MHYRAEIDGLRALAVISVILYHSELQIFGQQWLTGGFIGVDIFFVISGYLIASIILSELYNKDKFAYKRFYEKRARRILPMLFVICLVSMPLAWHLLLPPAFIEYTQSLLSAIFFGSNIYFYFNTTEYGADSSLLKPLLHTWSLGVEEQFYLFFPILAALLHKLKKSFAILILILISLSSLILSQELAILNSQLNFYWIFSRIWELIAGAIIAYIALDRQKKYYNHITQFLPLIGLVLIIFSIYHFSNNTIHPGMTTIIPVLGTSLIILFSTGKDITSRLLSTKPLVFIGLISYSLYLWHFPVFAFIRVKYNDPHLLILISIIPIFVLSILSYYFIEKPFRSEKISTSSFTKLAVSTALLMIIFSLVVIKADGFPKRISWITDKSENMLYYRREYWLDNSRFIDADNFSEEKISVEVIGNSWGHDIANAISFATNFEVSFRGMTGYDCNEFILPNLSETHKEYQRWKTLCEKNINRFSTIKNNTDIVVLADSIRVKGQYNQAKRRSALISNIEQLRQSGFSGPIVIIKNRPTWKNKGAYNIINQFATISDDINIFATKNSLTKSIDNLRSIDFYYEEFYKDYNVHYLSLVPLFCPNDICLLVNQNKPLFFDPSHLTLDGCLFASKYISDFLRLKLNNQ